MVEETGERIRLRLVLESRTNLGVVERQRRGIAEALGQLEIVAVERSIVAEALDVERALDRVARDQGDRDQSLRLVRRRTRHGHDTRV
jgi:hypothetical protein